MYATEQTYVTTYLAISFVLLPKHGRIVQRTIRTNNNCAYHHHLSQLVESIPVRSASHLKNWHRLVQTIEYLD